MGTSNIRLVIKQLKIILFSVAAMVLLLSSCRKNCYDKTNPDCENYDQCYGQFETSADFIVEENLYPFGKIMGENVWIQGDTIRGYGTNTVVRFTARFDADSFIWSIGANTFYTKTVLQRGFPQGKHIPIQLIAINKNPSRSCFPNDNGRDTVIRNVYVWPSTSNDSIGSPNLRMFNPYLVRGRFKGTFKSNPSKEVIVRMYDSIEYCPISTDKWRKAFYMDNIPEGYSSSKNPWDCGRMSGTVGAPFGSWGQKDVFNFGSSDTLVRVTFVARLQPDRRTIKIKTETYHLWSDLRTIYDEFTGVKID